MPSIDSDQVNINSITLKEQADNPTTAPAGKWRLYTKADGLYVIDDAGAVLGPIGPRRDYIMLQDQKSQNTPGGTLTAGAWRTRDINTEVLDTGNHASIASNQITLAAGTYIADIVAMAGNPDGHQARLFNVTDNEVLLLGTSQFTQNATSGVNIPSIIKGRFTLAASKVIEVQHYGKTTQNTAGFGYAANIGTEVYLIAQFIREP